MKHCEPPGGVKFDPQGHNLHDFGKAPGLVCSNKQLFENCILKTYCFTPWHIPKPDTWHRHPSFQRVWVFAATCVNTLRLNCFLCLFYCNHIRVVCKFSDIYKQHVDCNKHYLLSNIGFLHKHEIANCNVKINLSHGQHLCLMHFSAILSHSLSPALKPTSERLYSHIYN